MTATREVKTAYDRKPIPSGKFDWSAWYDGDEERGTGFGPTEEDAIIDLEGNFGYDDPSQHESAD